MSRLAQKTIFFLLKTKNQLYAIFDLDGQPIKNISKSLPTSFRTFSKPYDVHDIQEKPVKNTIPKFVFLKISYVFKMKHTTSFLKATIKTEPLTPSRAGFLGK